MWHIGICPDISSRLRRPRTAVTPIVPAPCIPCKHTDCAESSAFPARKERLSRMMVAISACVAPVQETAQWRGKTGKLAGLDPALPARLN